MKPYFAKYLPVEGEIKEGDKYFFNKGRLVTVYGEKGLSKDIASFANNQNCKAAKLFLCSRNIQVGDKYKCPKYPDATEYDDVERYASNPPEGSFKEIGEISPDALSYVKEGDEFGDDEVSVSRHYRLDSGKLSRKLRNKDYHDREVKLCKIKGPCGHFH